MTTKPYVHDDTAPPRSKCTHPSVLASNTSEDLLSILEVYSASSWLRYYV